MAKSPYNREKSERYDVGLRPDSMAEVGKRVSGGGTKRHFLGERAFPLWPGSAFRLWPNCVVDFCLKMHFGSVLDSDPIVAVSCNNPAVGFASFR